jgi:hypothetical protein
LHLKNSLQFIARWAAQSQSVFRVKPTADSVSNRTDMHERNDLSLGSRAARDTTEHRPLRTIASSSAPSAALFREGRRQRDGATATTATGPLLMHNSAHIIG